MTEFTRIRTARGIVVCGRVNNNLNVTRSFGDYEITGQDYDNNCFPQLIISDPEVFSTKLQQKKPVIGLLCSDGFTDYFCSGMHDLNSQNIEKKLLEPLATIICKLIECGRPISGLAFDLVCLMNWNKSVDIILNSIHTSMNWDSIKNESSSWKSHDNVSVVVFEVSDSQDNTSEVLHPQQSLTVNDHRVDNKVSDNKEGLFKQNYLNEQELKIDNINLDSFQRSTIVTVDQNQEKLMTVENLGYKQPDNNGSNNSKTTDDNMSKNSSIITKIFNYAKSFISLKRICLGTFGFFLTAYILKQLYCFKNA